MTVTTTATDSYHGTSGWFTYATQTAMDQPCDPDRGVVWGSYSDGDGSVPRDSNGLFTAPGTYETLITFKPAYYPKTKLCLYVTTMANVNTTGPQLVASALLDMRQPAQLDSPGSKVPSATTGRRPPRRA